MIESFLGALPVFFSRARDVQKRSGEDEIEDVGKFLSQRKTVARRLFPSSPSPIKRARLVARTGMEVPIKERIWNWALGLTDCLLRELTLGPKFQDNKIVVPPAVKEMSKGKREKGRLVTILLSLPPPHHPPLKDKELIDGWMMTGGKSSIEDRLVDKETAGLKGKETTLGPILISCLSRAPPHPALTRNNTAGWVVVPLSSAPARARK